MLSIAGCKQSASADPIFFGKEPPDAGKSDKSWSEELAKGRGAGKATVRKVKGNTLALVHGKRLDIQVGMKLGAGDVIQTASDGQIDLQLGDNGRVIQLRENSSLRIGKLDIENTGIETIVEVFLELHEGKILGGSQKMAAASSFYIWTPSGVVQPKGEIITADGK